MITQNKAMRSLTFLNGIIFIGLLAFGCEKDSLPIEDLYPDTLMGHWDIEGGGTIFFEGES